MLRIDFTRGENGKLLRATCATPKGNFAISGVYSKTVKGFTGESGGSDGILYRMIAILATAGHVGEPFEAHDGRMVCLEGIIDKLAVSVRCGGEKKE